MLSPLHFYARFCTQILSAIVETYSGQLVIYRKIQYNKGRTIETSQPGFRVIECLDRFFSILQFWTINKLVYNHKNSAVEEGRANA
jgi:hypothetical protein